MFSVSDRYLHSSLMKQCIDVIWGNISFAMQGFVLQLIYLKNAENNCFSDDWSSSYYLYKMQFLSSSDYLISLYLSIYHHTHRLSLFYFIIIITQIILSVESQKIVNSMFNDMN